MRILASGPTVYEPGKPIEEVARHGLQPDQIWKTRIKRKPWGASELAKKQHRRFKSGTPVPRRIWTSVDPWAFRVSRTRLSQFVLGNGSNEIIELLGMFFSNLVMKWSVVPMLFVVYKLVALLMGAKVVEVEMHPHS